METQSIRVIEKKVIELKKNFNVFCNTYNKNKQGVTVFPFKKISRKEYDGNYILDEISNIIKCLEYLTKSYHLFLNLSSYDEIKDISNYLDELNLYIKNTDLSKIAEILDSLKPLLRPYDIYIKEECYRDCNSSIEKLKQKVNELQEEEIALKENQEAITKDYKMKLNTLTQEHSSHIKEVADLIEKSKQALQDTTAAGISAAFQTQYEEARNTWNTRPWLIAAIIFLLITIAIGSWIVGGWWIIETASHTYLYSLIGRLSMIPLTITACVFCANQYIKQKNIIEDYAYKTALSKSIIAFSEELRKKEGKEYSEYISTVLKEIHQDPLRKRSKTKDEVYLKEGNLTLDILSKLEELCKLVIKSKEIN